MVGTACWASSPPSPCCPQELSQACLDGGVRAPNLAAHGVARVVRAACRPNCDNGDFPSASNACSIHCRPGVTLRMAVTDDRAAGRPRPVRAAGDGPGQGADLSPFDRQPPQDLTAEQSVLGGMLLSK